MYASTPSRESGKPPPNPPEVGKETALGRANYGSKAPVTPGFDALVAEADFIGAAAPGGGGGAILGTPRLFLWAPRASAFSGRSSSCGNPDIGICIHQSGINDQALTVDHPRFRGDSWVFANRHNDAASNDNGRAFDRRPGNRHDLSATNGKVLRLAALRMN